MSNYEKETGHVADERTHIAGINGGVLGNEPVTNKEPTVDYLNVRQSFSASINPLVAAAATVLSKLVEIKYTKKISDFAALKADLKRELGSFHARASELEAEGASLNDASYVLCTVLDEAAVLAQGAVAKEDKNAWSESSLLLTLQGDSFGGQKFFEMLIRLRGNPLKNLDMLELMYLCLALEFKGQYHSADKKGEAELAEIRDGLYRTIRHLRGDVPRELSPHWQGLKDQRRSLVRIVPWWLVVLFTLMCLAIMYSGFAWVLSEQRETVLEPYRQLDSALILPAPHDKDA